MAKCENCNHEISESSTYIYTMESPNGRVKTLDLCINCASEVIAAVDTALAKQRKFVKNMETEHLYDDIPGEVL